MSERREPLFTTQQAASMIGITDGYLRTLVSQGRATPQTEIGGTLMFSKAEIERLRNRPRQRKEKSK